MHALPDLHEQRFGLRFAAAATETDYRHWRNAQIIPTLRLAGLVALPVWLCGPLSGYLWRPDIDWLRVWALGYALVVPLLLMMIALLRTPLRAQATPLAAFTLAVAGLCDLWIIAHEVPAATGFDDFGPAVVNTVLVACFALFMRLPPLAAALAIAPFTLLTSIWIVLRWQHGVLAGLSAYPYLMLTASTIFLVVAMSIAGEHFMRRLYRVERTREAQHQALLRSQNLIRRYVPPALAQQIIDGCHDDIETPQRRRVTMLFSDIVGFTELADRVEPEVLTQVISEYMSTMATLIDAHGGTVNEFTGDGLMALFGAPQTLTPEAQALGAVRAAQAMQAQLPAMNARWRKLGLGAPLQIRIGINTGMVSAGSYGAEGRMTYTAIGLQTNIAARLQTLCEPGAILIGDSTWQLVREAIPCTALGERTLKGVHHPVTVYAVPAGQTAS